MMLTRPNRKARPVLREKSGEDAALWRIFDPDFKGKVQILVVAEVEEGFNLTIRDNFRIPDRDAMKAPLPQGKDIVYNFLTCFVKKFTLLICLFDDLNIGDLGALGDFDVKGAPKKQAEEKAASAGERKRSRLQTKRTAAVSQPKPAVVSDDVGEKTADRIFDTVDSHDNLISPEDNLNLKFADVEKQKSPAVEKASGSASGGTDFEGPSIQPGESELEFYYRTYTEDRSEENARLRAEAEVLVRAAREGAEQLEKEKAAFEQYKQTEEWAATAGLKQVRTLAKLLSNERKSWKESLSDERKSWKEFWAKQNEKLFRVRQEVTNLKAANVALMKEKTAAEAVAKEAKEAESRDVKALEEANTDRNNLNKTVEGLQIVRTILDTPENAAAVGELRVRAREAGFKAGYNRCISHMNLLSQGKFTDERSGFYGVDTETRLAAAVEAYNNLSLSALNDIDNCLDAKDYVDRLRLLFSNPEEEKETVGSDKGDAGTSGTKKD
ncbi:hypothetical protein HanXRQr2_Chr07g0293271 [Helianthus annuus]|uniref:Uncharacterized protein n=1 Tax=Helianthus annuus TaxID=4232 RepID=A0A9K3NFJ7_HELAN|nr:hypothetical protein HanXRQr2_Chr07g0293271 [Helianthus annuus]KAJ0904586.1 hypothetical protein HanPSC8_Chr07g0283971 [Helianthus annuus]